MATQTYCVAADVEFVLSEAGVTARVDDEETGARSAGGDAFVTTAIERAARTINGFVRHQYKLADVTASGWLKDANAHLAAEILEKRRGNPVAESLASDCDEFRKMLTLIKDGTDQIPEQLPSFDARATVTNSVVQLGAYRNPVGVSRLESTGPDPVAPTKRTIMRGWF